MNKTHIDISINKLVLLRKLLKEAIEEYKKQDKKEMIKKYKGQIILIQMIIDEEHTGINKYIDNLKQRIEKMKDSRQKDILK